MLINLNLQTPLKCDYYSFLWYSYSINIHFLFEKKRASSFHVHLINQFSHLTLLLFFSFSFIVVGIMNSWFKSLPASRRAPVWFCCLVRCLFGCFKTSKPCEKFLKGNQENFIITCNVFSSSVTWTLYLPVCNQWHSRHLEHLIGLIGEIQFRISFQWVVLGKKKKYLAFTFSPLIPPWK